MGRVAAPYAVHGWVKIQTFSEYTDGLLDYPIWRLGKQLGWKPIRVLEAKQHGQYLVAHLEGIDDRDAAERIRGCEIAIGRDELPPADEVEDGYYWNDLIGLTVIGLAGASLGKVTGLLETGAHDVLQVAGERDRLIPFVDPIIRRVDREVGCIEVDWDADW